MLLTLEQGWTRLGWGYGHSQLFLELLQVPPPWYSSTTQGPSSCHTALACSRLSLRSGSNLLLHPFTSSCVPAVTRDTKRVGGPALCPGAVRRRGRCWLSNPVTPHEPAQGQTNRLRPGPGAVSPPKNPSWRAAATACCHMVLPKTQSSSGKPKHRIRDPESLLLLSIWILISSL